MFGWLQKWLSNNGAGSREDTWLGGYVRRWDAAKTDRLNRAHWANAKGDHINADLDVDLETLRTRSAFEASNNPLVEGVVNTHCNDVVGAEGPTLQVQSDSDGFNEAAESVWRDWWQNPDVNGQLSGPEMLKLWVRGLWVNGEYLAQIVTANRAGGPVAMRLLCLDPRRLVTPPGQDVQNGVTLGVRRTKTGRPLGYFISEPLDNLSALSLIPDSEEIPAADIIHGFKVLEPGQARGVPWLAPVLQVVADLRDYDAQVLDAARQAADFAVLLYATSEDAGFVSLNESTEIERRTIRNMPPGWQPMQLKPEQPSTNYVDYRAERLRELGRPVGMPLMTVTLDSSGHNYSSARFDGQVYQRGNAGIQKWMEHHTLNRMADSVLREARLAGALPAGPAQVRYQWVWPVPPHVDPTKEANAETIRLQNKTLTLSKALAAHGMDLESTIQQLQREKKLLAAAGLDGQTQPDAGRAFIDAIVRGVKEAQAAAAGSMEG